jgi:hypothetical protein
MFTTKPSLTVEQFRWMKELSLHAGLSRRQIPQAVLMQLMASRYVEDRAGRPIVTPAGKAALVTYRGPLADTPIRGAAR